MIFQFLLSSSVGSCLFSWKQNIVGFLIGFMWKFRSDKTVRRFPFEDEFISRPVKSYFFIINYWQNYPITQFQPHCNRLAGFSSPGFCLKHKTETLLYLTVSFTKETSLHKNYQIFEFSHHIHMIFGVWAKFDLVCDQELDRSNVLRKDEKFWRILSWWGFLWRWKREWEDVDDRNW